MRMFILLLGTAVAAHGQLSRPSTTTHPNGTVRVENSGPSRWAGTDGWKLVLEKTITPEEGSPGMIGEPVQIAVSRNGEIVVSDWKASGLLVFAADGHFLRRVGGIGKGPGEFAAGPAIDVRGDTIAGATDGRILIWRVDGTLLSQWVTVGTASRPLRLDGTGHVFVGATLPGPSPGRPAAIKYRFDGMAVDTIELPARQMLGWRVGGGGLAAVPFRPVRLGRFDSRSRYVSAFSSEYAFVVARRGIDTATIVTMSGQSVPVAKTSRDSMVNLVMAKPMLRDVAKAEDIPTVHPYFYDFQIDEQDNIWVPRPNDRGITVSFDVINAAGAFLGSVAAPAAMKAAPVFANGRMYRFAENADGIPIIEVYRVDRGRY